MQHHLINLAISATSVSTILIGLLQANRTVKAGVRSEIARRRALSANSANA
jgi:hypothetical protein